MAWRRPEDKPLFEPMMAYRLSMHICVSRPQWVKTLLGYNLFDITQSHNSLIRAACNIQRVNFVQFVYFTYMLWYVSSCYLSNAKCILLLIYILVVLLSKCDIMRPRNNAVNLLLIVTIHTRRSDIGVYFEVIAWSFSTFAITALYVISCNWSLYTAFFFWRTIWLTKKQKKIHDDNNMKCVCIKTHSLINWHGE